MRNAAWKIWATLFTATTAEKNINFLIEHQCPQCGAPAALEETDRFFTCEFCRVKSYLHCRKYFRYMLPANAPAGTDLFFFPYWRFKGMAFACAASGIKDKILDFNRQAVETPYFPFSVGFRSQVLKLKFAAPETKGYFIKPGIPVEHVKELMSGQFKSPRTDPVIHKTCIGETISLIYSPAYVTGKVYDAVLNEPFSTNPPEDLDITTFSGGRPDWRIEFIPSQCPDCGWDLDGDREALIVNCKNCNSLWRPSKDRFKKIKFSYIPMKKENGEKENTVYFPFWKIGVEISGIELKTYADLVKVGNLPKVVYNGRKDEAFFFWSPAIKIRPSVFLNLSRGLTLVQPKGERTGELPGAALYPVTLSVREAADSLKINLAGFMKPQESIPEILPHIAIEPKNSMLVYVPFIEGHHEYIHPDCRIAIHKSLIRTAKNL